MMMFYLCTYIDNFLIGARYSSVFISVATQYGTVVMQYCMLCSIIILPYAVICRSTLDGSTVF